MASLSSPKAAQERFFKKMLHELSASAYGRALKVTKEMSYQEFIKVVPIVSYDDIGPLIEPPVKEKKSALLSSPIKSYEITSGSSGRNKTIPYSKAALSSFRKMAAIWVHDILKSTPKLKNLKIFYAISPPRAENTLGFNDDEEYLGAIGKLITAKFSVIPKHLHQVSDFHHFRFLLSIHLLTSPSLEVIYIWSPSYWLSLMEFMLTHKRALIKILNQGYYDFNQHRYYLKETGASSILAKKNVNWSKIWPNLQVISCWTDAQASGFCDQLKAILPEVKIQPKGLLATEGVMTIKIDGISAPVPFIEDAFFEFMKDSGEVFPLTKLCQGEQYELIVSNLSGLYRYRTFDVVKVVGFYEKTPLLRFMGRGNRTSDMVGEKITEGFINEMVEVFSLKGFNILIPDYQEREYILFTSDQEYQAKTEPKEVDEFLSKNCHYAYARLLGQLGPPKVIFEPQMSSAYEQYYLDQGMKWGDIKMSSLITNVKDAKDLLAKIRTGVEQ